MTTLTDALTGSGNLGANWTVTGTWERTASGARQTSGGGAYRKAAYTGAALASNNYRVEATVAYDSTTAVGAGVGGRWASGSTVSGYGLVRFGTEVYWIEVNAGTPVTEALVATPGTSSAVLAQEYEGSTIRSYVDGALVDTRTDATYASGTPGLMCYDGSTLDVNYLTTWSAADLAVDSHPQPLLIVAPALPLAYMEV